MLPPLLCSTVPGKGEPNDGDGPWSERSLAWSMPACLASRHAFTRSLRSEQPLGLVDAGLGLFYDRSPLDHRSLGACNMVGVISRSPATSDQWHEDQEYVLSHTTLSAEEGGSTDCWLEPVIKPWRNSSANLSRKAVRGPERRRFWQTASVFDM